jgi:hypothetical protein
VAIVLPYQPRPWQATAHKGIAQARRSLLICSRQVGKTWGGIAQLGTWALEGPEDCSHCYLSPKATQARQMAWPRLKQYLAPMGKHVTLKETELCAVLPGNRRIHLMGAEQGEAIRGNSFRTIVCDERDNISDEFWVNVMLPTLNAHGADARVLFIGTLSGANSKLWRMYIERKADPEWFTMVVPGSKSGCYTAPQLAQMREEMGEPAYLREIECDPNAPVARAVLGREVAQAELDHRIRPIPWEPGRGIHTAWDLGIRDAMAIWGFTIEADWLRWMFYEEFTETGADEVINHLRTKYEPLGVGWGTAILPHDAKSRGPARGHSVEDVFDELWPGPIEVFQAAPSPLNTLSAARRAMPKSIFNEEHTRLGISRLKSARYKVDGRTDTVLNVIEHDDSSHCLDAFRYGCWEQENMRPALTGMPYDVQPIVYSGDDWRPESRFFE